MANGRAIDHVVLAVRSLDRTQAIYEGLGFTLTPRAFHEDRMGTSNRLAQFQDRNFIELLEVDRPAKLQPHDFARTPPVFSFGDHNRQVVAARDGLSMLVFTTDDARADIRRFEAQGLQSFAPFDFERQAKLPDGSEVTVAFSLGFAWSPHMPRVGFFVCQNRAQSYFWKPAFQVHANGAQGIKCVHLASPEPERDAAFLAAMLGGDRSPIPDGVSVSCGPFQEVRVVTPPAIIAIDPSFDALSNGPILAGVTIASAHARATTPASSACGMFLEWVKRDP
jgi:catechol 2,3-dioxygenase-like lactoylglutathione lyase family enzyme